jgi:hypothetical protein
MGMKPLLENRARISRYKPLHRSNANGAIIDE